MAKKVKQISVPSPPKTEEKVETTNFEVEPVSLPWFTLEAGLYGVIFVVGLALRLWNLGSYPLSDVEAQQSLIALQLYHGNLPEVTTSYSPLLASLNALIFLLLHESEATARLASVLLGSGLVVLPITLRRQLGPAVCLLTSGLLAISPTAIFLSRTLNSEIAVAIGALMLLSGFFNWADDGQRHWLYLAAGGAAILLTAGPMAYSIIIVFGLIVLLRLAAFKAVWAQGAEKSARVQAPSQTVEERSSRSRKSSAESKRKSPANPHLRQAGIFLLVVLILLATAATFNLSGLGVSANLFTDWLGRFSFQPQADAGFNAIFLLTIYEPLLVGAGLVGLAYAILSGNLLRLVIGGWFVGSLILDLIVIGRPNGNIMLSLVPLAFLAAFALAELWFGLQKEGSWSNEGIILAAGLVIAGFGYIGLTGWLGRTCNPDDLYCQYAWLQAAAALVLFLVIVIFFWVTAGGAAPALRGMALTGVVLGLIVSINISWRLNYGPLMHLSYQPLAGIPASTELLDLTETLASESSIRAGDKTLLDTTLVGATSPSLQWQLRDYRHLGQVSAITESPTSSAIITSTTDNEQFNPGEAYIGQDFAVNAIWSPVGMQLKEFINWLIYREAEERPQSDKVVLWLRWGQS